jgi:drug/metabolite transporter (DMT)-like permease
MRRRGLRRAIGLGSFPASPVVPGGNTLSYWALQFTQALDALLIQSSGPLFVALWPPLLFGIYAPPIRIPTTRTITPPSTIWNTACRNGVSI